MRMRKQETVRYAVLVVTALTAIATLAAVLLPSLLEVEEQWKLPLLLFVPIAMAFAANLLWPAAIDRRRAVYIGLPQVLLVPVSLWLSAEIEIARGDWIGYEIGVARGFAFIGGTIIGIFLTVVIASVSIIATRLRS